MSSGDSSSSCSSMGPDDSKDLLKCLPEEVACLILRKLDSKSLVAAASTSKYWNGLCHSEKVLRTRIRRQLRKERMIRQMREYELARSIQMQRRSRRHPGVWMRFGHESHTMYVFLSKNGGIYPRITRRKSNAFIGI